MARNDTTPLPPQTEAVPVPPDGVLWKVTTRATFGGATGEQSRDTIHRVRAVDEGAAREAVGLDPAAVVSVERVERVG